MLHENYEAVQETEELMEFPEKDMTRVKRRSTDMRKALRKKNISVRHSINGLGYYDTWYSHWYISEHGINVPNKSEVIRDENGVTVTGSLHRYVKGKIHCSCPLCAYNYKTHGKSRERWLCEKRQLDSASEAMHEYAYKEAENYYEEGTR